MKLGRVCPSCNTSVDLRVKDQKFYNFGDQEDTESRYLVVIGYCPNCLQFMILCQHTSVQSQEYHSDDHGYHWQHEITGILLDTIVFPNSPKISYNVDPVVPEPYKREFIEACAVLPVSPRASAALSRRLLQNILRNHFQVKSKTDRLYDEIDALIQSGKVDIEIQEDLHYIRQIGNIAVHPSESKSTGQILDIEPNEAEGLIAVIYELFEIAFVRRHRIEQRRKIWKPKVDDAK